MSQAYVLLSGGVDSSTCLYLAKDLWGSVTAISLLYGQRHTVEIEAARKIAATCDVDKHIISDISNVVGIGGLTDNKLDIPQVSYDELPEGVSPTYVPFRNGLMLSIVASLAAADPEAKIIMYGAHAEDAANDAYPDCSNEFVMAMRKAIAIGTYGRISVDAPFVHHTKSAVIAEGNALGVPYEYTWSCYEGKEKHCGLCPTCRARKQAFLEAGISDPTAYYV